jgi:hypothetical protein
MIHYETKTEGTFTMIYNTGWRHHVATPESGAASMCPGTCSLTHFPKTQNMHKHRTTSTQRVPSSHTIWYAGNGDWLLQLAAQPQGAHTGDELDF